MSEAKMIPLSEFHLLGEREKMFLEVFSIGGISTMQDHLPRTMNLSEGDDIIVSVIIASRKSEFFATLEAINVRSADETVDGILSKMHMMLGESSVGQTPLLGRFRLWRVSCRKKPTSTSMSLKGWSGCSRKPTGSTW